MTSGELPWRSLEDPAQWVSGLKTFFAGCPKEYIHILLYIDSLHYYDTPSYAMIRGLLRDVLDINGLFEYPYDWEQK
uniref:Transposase n=1 Tax=Heterorhabditis bacteriophora TaxID=37862 RepID=A0A1I7X4C1_HETBA